MSTNNRLRLLGLMEILKKHSDEDNHLTMSQLLEKLDHEYGLKEFNRKTIYEDLAALNDVDFNVTFDKGYYSVETPFTLSEIKIILDALHSLRNLDEHFLNEIKEKLYSFISIYERDFLEEYNLFIPSDDRDLIYKLETILYALKNQTSLIVQIKDEKREIIPLFLRRENDYYYLHFEFEGYKKKTYQYRLDHILKVDDTKIKKEPYFKKEQLFKKIKASTDAFYSGQEKRVKLEVLFDHERNIQRIKDEFPNAIIKGNTASIIVSINDVFFSKITSFKNQVEIKEPEDVINQYQVFLKDILNHYISKD